MVIAHLCIVLALELVAAPAPDSKTAPDTKTAVAAVLARHAAVTSGSFDFRCEGEIVGKFAGRHDRSFVFDGENWLVRYNRGISLNHKGTHLELTSGGILDGIVQTDLTIYPDQPISSQTQHVRPPRFAGTLWSEGTAHFLQANSAAGKFLEDRKVNGVDTHVYEWDVSKTELATFGSYTNRLGAEGGEIRLFVSEKLGYALPRIEILTIDGQVEMTFDSFDFQEFAPDVFIPLRLERRSDGYTMRYLISNVSHINEHFPADAFMLDLPIGTIVWSGDGGRTVNAVTTITKATQLEAFPMLVDHVRLTGARSIRGNPGRRYTEALSEAKKNRQPVAVVLIDPKTDAGLAFLALRTGIQQHENNTRHPQHNDMNDAMNAYSLICVDVTTESAKAFANSLGGKPIVDGELPWIVLLDSEGTILAEAPAGEISPAGKIDYRSLIDLLHTHATDPPAP